MLDDLTALDEKGLRRHRRTLDSMQSAHVTVDGTPYVAFCSNDYLGLASHPALIAAAQAGATTYGLGAGASHLVLGHSRAHEQLEQALAAFTGLPRALLFSTGYMAN
ncbi:MAG TPA: aminotransferase class I/II-fold pyridoxal phosphate-dependent enzyme, partial [Burkholderiales bacterium]|nr:aminotransferase class I/II-fold pyridoxal phosphate-dependent enzyme [Burkholderiales bacterium]